MKISNDMQSDWVTYLEAICIKDDNQTIAFALGGQLFSIIKEIAFASSDSCMDAKGFAVSSSQS